jgi:hypothetical protein
MTLSSTTFSVRVVSEPRNWTRKHLRGAMLTKPIAARPTGFDGLRGRTLDDTRHDANLIPTEL